MFPIHDENRPTIRPLVNYCLILLNVLVFFFYLGGVNALNSGIIFLGAIPNYILSGRRLWTLLTSMFLHVDIIHLFGNMVYLWVFGDNIEDALGHAKYLAFYLLGGLVASFTHIISLFALPSLGVAGFDIPSVGASGAISAVLGAYLVLYPRARIRTILFYFFIQIVSIRAFYYLGFWFLYQLILGVFSLSGFSSGVAFWAHIGGFVAGSFIIKLLGVKPKPRRMVDRKIPVRPLYVTSEVITPFVDVLSEENRLRIVAELSGVEEKDIEVEVSDNEVLISVKRGERRYFRRIMLPSLVIPHVENFSYRNGVLSFTLQRKSH